LGEKNKRKREMKKKESDNLLLILRERKGPKRKLRNVLEKRDIEMTHLGVNGKEEKRDDRRGNKYTYTHGFCVISVSLFPSDARMNRKKKKKGFPVQGNQKVNIKKALCKESVS
jgi:hypothetical protein